MRVNVNSYRQMETVNENKSKYLHLCKRGKYCNRFYWSFKKTCETPTVTLNHWCASKSSGKPYTSNPAWSSVYRDIIVILGKYKSEYGYCCIFGSYPTCQRTSSRKQHNKKQQTSSCSSSEFKTRSPVTKDTSMKLGFLYTSKKLGFLYTSKKLDLDKIETYSIPFGNILGIDVQFFTPSAIPL